VKLPISARLKRHIALPLLLVVILLVVVMLIQVRDTQQLATYTVKNWYGDASVLEDVVISGAVIDANHTTSFSWRENEVAVETNVYPYAQDEWRYLYSDGFYKRIGEYYYSNLTQSLAQEFYISRQRFQHNQSISSESALAIIPINRIYNLGENMHVLTNEITYGLAEADGEVFFTAPTTRLYKGMNGIYKLSFSDKQAYITPRDRQQSAPIMTFSMEQNEQHNSSYIEVLGLEAVGDKLALITIKDDALHIDGYSTTGEGLGEIEVAPFRLVSRDSSTEEESAGYYESYEAYSNHHNETLSLSFLDRNGIRKIVSIDFSSGVELVDLTQFPANQQTLQEDRDYAHGARFITFKQGKLYYGGVFRSASEGARGISEIAPASFLLHVYEQGELIYKGELMTDINDDLIRLNRPNMYSLSYSISDYRRILDVSIH
jgi:hypothetical protein